MELIRKKLGVVQNMGWLDRVLRVLVGIVMLGYPIFLLLTTESVSEQWPFYSMILSIYPWLTGIIGVDPIYKMFGARTCDNASGNACGTFPYEVDAALGNKPIPKNDEERSLADSRH